MNRFYSIKFFRFLLLEKQGNFLRLHLSFFRFFFVLILISLWTLKSYGQLDTSVKADGIVHPNVTACLPGYHWDYVQKKCVSDASTACPLGSHWDEIVGGCVLDDGPPILPPPTPPSVTYTPLYNNSNFSKTIDLTKPVGAIEGSANVSNGAVTYTIPIFCSPGTNGVQPSISITYNSQASFGIVGYGWNISGLSVISRTGKDIYHNDMVQPVKYNTEDAFVLDGMRLNAISGSNGANGTIYAGESETFAKIVSKTSSSANNPDWFQITTKDGTILEYGHTTDSRIKTDDGLNVMFWRLNRSRDINGNFIDYIYDNTGRDSRIKTIKYTGNINTGLQASNSIVFNYALKSDQNSIYDAGASVSTKYLLTGITVTADNDKAVKSYQFNYGFDNINSFLKEVIEKGNDGTALNSTIFLYGDKPQNIVSTSSGVLTGPLSFIPGDFNADGKSDLLSASYTITDNIKYHTSYSIYSDISQTSATVLYSNTPLPGNTIKSGDKNMFNFLSTDYNGDGRDDI